MKKFLLSVCRDMGRALGRNEYLRPFFRHHSRLFSFLRARFSPSGRYGFSFSLGALLSTGLLFFFLSLAQNILAQDSFVEADVRLMNLVALLRTPETAQVFLFFTHLGSGAVVVALGTSLSLLFALSGRRRTMFFLAFSLVVSQTLYVIFKLLVHRARPDEVFAWVARGGYSFPSGHTTSSMIFYGMLAFFLWRIAHRKSIKLLILWFFGLLIFLIGFSRMYLGVHWLSDVIAGWALGGALLLLFIAFYNEQQKFEPNPQGPLVVSRVTLLTVTLIFGLSLGAFIYHYNLAHSLEIRRIEPRPELAIASEPGALEKTILSEHFPKYSEALTGKTMEPINFVVVGSEAKLMEAFAQAGWYRAENPHAKDLFRLGWRAFRDQSYPTAPVTPAFIAREPNVAAFQKPTEKNSVRERHHTRYWKTDFEWQGQRVWVATASFDDGLPYYIAHHIAPDVDTEREFIHDELLHTGRVEELGKLQLVRSFLGQNQAADPFFTDGQTYLLRLK